METGKRAVFVTGVALAAALGLSRCPGENSEESDEALEDVDHDEEIPEDGELGSLQDEFHDAVTHASDTVCAPTFCVTYDSSEVAFGARGFLQSQKKSPDDGTFGGIDEFIVVPPGGKIPDAPELK